MTLALGFDIGGSNLRAAAFRGESAAPIAVHREAVGDAREPGAIVERIARIATDLAARAGGASGARVPLGVGIAAMMRDRRGTVANSPHLRWRDVPFGELLRARAEQRFAVAVHNDANAIAWGEHVAGAARGHADALVVYVGTGIGSGVIANGRLLDGATSCAGELGHAKVRWDADAAPCACGQRGCFEAYCGGSYVARRIADELARGKRSTALRLAGAGATVRDVTPSHVDRAAAQGDDWALSLWTELAPVYAVALGNAVAVLNSSRLVLGGGLLSRAPFLVAMIETALAIATPAPSYEPLSVALAELGDDAGLVGAARLAATAATGS